MTIQAQQRLTYPANTAESAYLSGTKPLLHATSLEDWSPIPNLLGVREKQTELSEAAMQLPQPSLDQLWGFYSPFVTLCPAAMGKGCSSYGSS